MTIKYFVINGKKITRATCGTKGCGYVEGYASSARVARARAKKKWDALADFS